MGAIANIGSRTISRLASFGDFCRFCGRTFGWLVLVRPRDMRFLLAQFFEVGTRSIPVVMITGAFVGMILAVQMVAQFRMMGMTAYLGTTVILSVVRELGPVLAGVLLAGRVGGGQTAELGTMRVTEQIDALSAMGADPVRILVVPRFLASTLLIPALVMYASFMGIVGGFIISVYVYGISPVEFWRKAVDTVEYWDIFYGPIKSVFFGAAMSLICCFKGFRCAPGAAGVGRACTESFVASCMSILGLNFFLGMFLNTIYDLVYGVRSVL